MNVQVVFVFALTAANCTDALKNTYRCNIILQKCYAPEFPLFDHVAKKDGRERRTQRNQRKSRFPRTYRSRCHEVQPFDSHHVHAVFCLSNAQFEYPANHQFKRRQRIYDRLVGEVNKHIDCLKIICFDLL